MEVRIRFLLIASPSIGMFPWPGSIAPGWITRFSPVRSPPASATSSGTAACRARKRGILLPGEPLILRFLLAKAAVLGGIALVVIEKRGTV